MFKKINCFIILSLFSQGLLANDHFVEVSTPRELPTPMEEGEEKSKGCGTAHKVYVFLAGAGLVTAGVGLYMLSQYEETEFDINDPSTVSAESCDESLGADLKFGGLLMAGAGATAVVLNWCGKKLGCQNNRRTTNHDLNRASVMISRL